MNWLERALRSTSLALCLTTAACLVWAGYAFLRPALNWDIIPYMGITLIMDGESLARAQQKTYAALKTTPRFAELTGQKGRFSHYRAQVYGDVESFRQQFPFYTFKKGYNALVYLAYKAGAGLLKSTALVSVFFFAAVSLLTFFWLSRYFKGLILFPLSLFVLIASGAAQTARFASPDMAFAFLIMLSLFLWREAKTPWAHYLAALAALAIRPDGIVLFFFLCLADVILEPGRLRWSAVFFILALAGHFYFKWASGHYGWSLIVFQNWIDMQARPAEIQPSVSIRQYLSILAQQFGYWWPRSRELLLLFGQGLMLLTLYRILGARQTRPLLVILAALNASILTHGLLFPELSYRFYAGQYLAICCLCLGCVRTLPAGKTGSENLIFK